MASPICLRLLLHCERRADSRAVCTAGNRRATRTPMIAMTTSSSTNVNAWRRVPALSQRRAIIRELLSAGQEGVWDLLGADPGEAGAILAVFNQKQTFFLAEAKSHGLGCGLPRQALFDGFCECDERFDAELFRASIGRQIKWSENFVDRGLIKAVAEGADEYAAQEFAAMLKEGADEFVKKGQIADEGPFGGVGQDVNDRRVDLGPGPKDLWLQFADDFDCAQCLHPDAEGGVVLSARWRDDPIGQLLLDGGRE